MKLKELFKYNRAAGIAALIAAILLSIFADANFSLIGDRNKIKREFRKADMAATLTKCADELLWLCDSAARLGADTESARQAARALQQEKLTPLASTAKTEAVFSAAVSIKAQLDTLSADRDQKAYRSAMDYYDAIGEALHQLASEKAYHEAVAAYREDCDRPLNRLMAPWFDDVADYEALEARFGSKFPEQPTEQPEPEHPVEGLIWIFEILENVFNWVVRALTWLFDWLTRHVWLAIVLIVFVVLGLFNGAKNK